MIEIKRGPFRLGTRFWWWGVIVKFPRCRYRVLFGSEWINARREEES